MHTTYRHPGIELVEGILDLALGPQQEHAALRSLAPRLTNREIVTCALTIGWYVISQISANGYRRADAMWAQAVDDTTVAQGSAILTAATRFLDDPTDENSTALAAALAAVGPNPDGQANSRASAYPMEVGYLTQEVIDGADDQRVATIVAENVVTMLRDVHVDISDLIPALVTN